MTEMYFLLQKKTKKYHAWSCQNVYDALTFLLDNIFIRFGTKLYRQVVGIPMGTNCAPLVADLFLFCYERDFMMSLSDDKQSDVIDAFNTTSRYLDDILNTVSHFSYAPFFQAPHFLTKILESNILYDTLFIDILSV